jgi:chemotaxis protein histidine kinase CheA
MQVRYFVPFKAVEQRDKAQFALKEGLINIEGVAIDTTVNKNKWQVPEEDLDYIVQTLKGAQLRVDHAESALMIVGKVVDAWRDGDKVLFRAEVGDSRIVEKIVRGYVSHVSIQVDSDEVECSKCKRQTRREGMLIHLCPGAWEVVRKPKVRELSIVASPAYENTSFQPLGFYAAMNDAQWSAVLTSLSKSGVLEPDSSRSSVSDGDVGSKPDRLQEPEDKNISSKMEVEAVSVNADQKPSPQVAQVNVAPEEQAPKPVDYEELIKQFEKLLPQMKAEEAKKLSKKLSELARRVKALESAKKSEEAEEAEETEEAKKSEEAEEAKEAEEAEETEETEEAKKKAPSPVSEAKKKSSVGKGVVAVDALEKDALANYEWFKDLLKAHRKLVGFQ